MSWPPNSSGARMQTRDFPPSLKSIIALGQVKRSGPHHCLTISGSPQAFHTSATGASKMRVKTRSCLLLFMCHSSLFIALFGRELGAEILGFKQLANLDLGLLARHWIRTAFDPVNGLLQRLALPDPEASH